MSIQKFLNKSRYSGIYCIERVIYVNNGGYDKDFSTSGKRISREELERQIGSMDKGAVEKKLRDMGMKDVADRLGRTSNEEILRMLSKNPDILRKLNQLMGGR